jgi:hypothetical protein
MSEHYKGRIIDPRAYELADGTGWTAEVYIAEDVGADTIDTPFFLRETFVTKEAALGAGLLVGRREVDKRIRSSEVQDIFDEANKLPATSRDGFGPCADIGVAHDGQPKSVPRLKTPDDPFRSE